jgi:ComF family protein
VGKIVQRYQWIKQQIKETLFPLFCLDCGAEGARWCFACLHKSIIATPLRCPVCEKITVVGEPCLDCAKASSLDRLFVIADYRESSSLGRLIKELKYDGAFDVREVWKMLFRVWLQQSNVDFFKEPCALIPVPLHKKRQAERGFNQAALLAECLKEECVFLTYDSKRQLVRTRHTAQQAKLSGEERRKNMNLAFAWDSSVAPPAKVLLVDDVFTTGTTMQECAKTLKNGGSTYVAGFALARAL